MKDYKEFNQFKKRLNTLDEDIRSLALEYAAEFFSEGKTSREEALEQGISRAELEKRRL